MKDTKVSTMQMVFETYFEKERWQPSEDDYYRQVGVDLADKVANKFDADLSRTLDTAERKGKRVKTQ